jgi:signal transduction histidine kinase
MNAIQQSSPGVDEGAETARLCHDLRQYVAAGIMLAGMRDTPGLDPDTKRRLAAIARVFEGINELLEDRYADQRRGTTVDLTVVVQECVEFAKLLSTVPIDTVLHGPVAAWAHPVLLRRAVMNVLSNAGRAAGVGGRVTVRTGEAGTHAWVEVSDDGAGFGRIPAVNGYGLSVVEAAMRASRGRLEIYSGPTPGTRVRLRLPRPRTGSASS